MNKREARAKAIVEAIVADLNKKFKYELYIDFKKDYMQLSSGRLLDWLSIRYPDHKLDDIHGSYGLVVVAGKTTYFRLFKKMLQTPEPCNAIMTYYGTNGDKSIPIDIKAMYGKTMDEIQIALDLAV